MKISHKIAAAALTAAIAVGGTSAAFAGGDNGGAGSAGKAARVAFRCEHQDEIVAHLTTRQANLTGRIATLTTAENKATAAGKTKIAERIAKRITTVQAKLDRVTERLAAAPAWIAEHCTTAG